MRNAILISGKRTGSTFLQECINSHPEMTCYDEMFMVRGGIKKRRGQFLYNHMRTHKKMSIKDYIEWLFSNKGAICFRLMYPHIEKHNQIIDIIKKNEYPVIHLIRENLLHHYISSKTKKDQKILIDKKDLKNKIEENEKKIERYRQSFSNSTDYMEIFYEKMIGRTEGEKGDVKKYGAFNIVSDQKNYLTKKYSKKICEFMDVEYRELYSNVTKRNKWNIWKHINNADDIKKFLKNSKWEHFL